jgi:hypothetical protein
MAKRKKPQKRGPNKPKAQVPGRWDRREWCAGALIGYSTFKTLAPECRPQSVLIGRRLQIIIEDPVEWLRRMSKMGGARTVSQSNAR